MSYRAEWFPIVLPWAGIVLLLIPPVAMLAVVVVALVAAGAVVALAGAVLAAPYLLTRSLHRRWRARGSVASHPHGKIVGRDMSTPREELSILYEPHPFVPRSRPRATAARPVGGE